MTIPEWTPGPWEYVPQDDHCGPYVTSVIGTVADCYLRTPRGVIYPHAGAYAGANARLIAAAPNLAKALEPLAAIPIGAEIESDRDLVLFGNAGRFITVGDVLEARAALRKALGETDHG